ncbi:MAG: histidinol dehydrogenase [Fibrobacterota bacterium]
MIRIVKGARSAHINRILSRGDIHFEKEETAVRNILVAVEKKGDAALFACAKKFDGLNISARNIRLTRAETETAADRCEGSLRKAIDAAANNIRAYHQKQVLGDFTFSPATGVKLRQRTVALGSIGLYVPGGAAPLFSTVLMTAIPAQVAGVQRIAVTTPCRGGLNPAMAYCFRLLGLTEIYRLGGAHAVAALALGTRSVPKVDKIAGPGNLYVSLAKRLLYGRVDIDMIAGPSEILIIADKSANPAFIARDLLSQSEHGSGRESSILLTTDIRLAASVKQEVERLMQDTPKQGPLRRALDAYGLIVILKNLRECVDLANRIAPEHLEIMTEKPEALLNGIRCAGAVFLGPYTCESVGDYFAGPSHVLPTNGTARFYSPLSVYHFVKRMSVIEYNADALKSCGEKIIRMAEEEGLRFHAEAVRART